ncbi:hypothetical protein [Haliscomenobacter sp.]|uniref:hypothetical protein n=1 Tax=Haliscomenobacter sp. TaxID=2717303 RepID=UPI003BACD361
MRQTIVSAKNRILLEKKSRKEKIKFGLLEEASRVLKTKVPGLQSSRLQGSWVPGFNSKRVWNIECPLNPGTLKPWNLGTLEASRFIPAF